MANSIDNTAGKIREKLNTVRNKRKASAKRCIWEMMQNAKDVFNPKYGGVSIEFEIADEHTFVFRHNGLHFRLKDVTCLIQQVSSKSSTNEDENVTGMFGTGFISTHLIADVIDVKSILLDSDDKYRSFTLRLDRSGSSKEELAPRIKDAMTEFAKLDNDLNGVLFPFVTDYEQHTEKDFDTSFTYRIETESQLQLAVLGINDLVNTLPVTMINLPTVKSVRVINRLEGTDVCYTCSRENKDANVVLSTIANGVVTKKYLTYTTPDVSLSIEVQENYGQWFAVKRDDKLPVLLRDFPLIGSHQFYFPYYLNGFRFVPTEPRDDIQIHGDSEDRPSVINRGIIDKAVEAALVFNQWLIEHNIHNRYLLASSRIPKSTEAWDEETSEPWIKELQKKWRAELIKQTLLECEDGVFPMSEMLLPDCSKKDSRETLWDILRPIANRKLPKKEHVHEWRDVMIEYDSWNCSLKYTTDQLLKDLEEQSDISWVIDKFGGDSTLAYAWLNKVIKFAFEELGSDAFESYAILPNQLGVFTKASSLMRDNTFPIPAEIKEVYKIAFSSDVNERLVDTNVDTLYINQSIAEYNLTSLVNDLNSFIKDTSKMWDNRRDASYRLCTLYSADALKPHRESMYELCKKFTPKVASFSYLANVPDDMWLEADKLILSYIPELIEYHKCTNITELGSNFLEYHEGILESEIIDWINRYISLCNAKQCTSQLSTALIFPNQKGGLKRIGELSFDSNIPEELKDLSEVASTVINWRSSLLDTRIEGYAMHSPKTVANIYNSISEAFDKSNEKLTIAKHALALNYNNNPDVAYIYVILKDIYKDVPSQKVLLHGDGFDWEKFVACAITCVAGEVASKINLNALASHLSNDTQIYHSAECLTWIDKFLNFALNYRGGRYKTKVTELDNHGVWVNQLGDFCMLSDLSKDGGIPEELKDLSATNPIVNFNYRSILLHNDSIMSNAIDSSKTITPNAVLLKIDESIETYSFDKQNPDFRALIFRLMELDKRLHFLDMMKYYKANKEKLIVGSLGEGETMNMVAGIIQQGDDKIRVVKELLESNSLEDLQKIRSLLQEGDDNRVVEFIKKTNPIDSKKMNAAQLEAQKVLLESRKNMWNFPMDYATANDDGTPICYSTEDRITDKVTGESIAIVLKSYKMRSEPFHINPNEWEWVVEKRAKLLVYTELNGEFVIVEVPDKNLVSSQSIQLSFSAENLNPQEHADEITKLAETLHYFKRLTFDFEQLYIAPDLTVIRNVEAQNKEKQNFIPGDSAI